MIPPAPIICMDDDYIPTAEELDEIRQEFIHEVYKNSFIFLSSNDGDN